MRATDEKYSYSDGVLRQMLKVGSFAFLFCLLMALILFLAYLGAPNPQLLELTKLVAIGSAPFGLLGSVLFGFFELMARSFRFLRLSWTAWREGLLNFSSLKPLWLISLRNCYHPLLFAPADGAEKRSNLGLLLQYAAEQGLRSSERTADIVFAFKSLNKVGKNAGMPAAQYAGLNMGRAISLDRQGGKYAAHCFSRIVNLHFYKTASIEVTGDTTITHKKTYFGLPFRADQFLGVPPASPALRFQEPLHLICEAMLGRASVFSDERIKTALDCLELKPNSNRTNLFLDIFAYLNTNPSQQPEEVLSRQILDIIRDKMTESEKSSMDNALPSLQKPQVVQVNLVHVSPGPPNPDTPPDNPPPPYSGASPETHQDESPRPGRSP